MGLLHIGDDPDDPRHAHMGEDEVMIVALYERVSTNTQTVDNQTLRLQNYAEDHGYIIYDKYCDVASGADPKRPQLDRLLRDAKLHKFDRILCVKIDRLARSMINLLDVMQKLDSYKVSISFLDQPFDTGTYEGRMMLQILGALAEFERELIRDRTNAGLERARAQGKVSGRPRKALSAYQLAKAMRILEEQPHISQRKLAEQFDGIAPKTLIKLLKEEGVL